MSSGRLTIPITLRSRDFAIVARHRATWEFAAFNTEASDGYVPLHAVLAHFLRERRAQTPYAAAEDFVFKGRGSRSSQHAFAMQALDGNGGKHRGSVHLQVLRPF